MMRKELPLGDADINCVKEYVDKIKAALANKKQEEAVAAAPARRLECIIRWIEALRHDDILQSCVESQRVLSR